MSNLPSLLTVIVLALLSTACATSSPPSSNAIALTARQAQIPPLPDTSRQPVMPSVCSPTCSAALTSERESWQTRLTALMPQDSPASGTTTPPAKQ